MRQLLLSRFWCLVGRVDPRGDRQLERFGLPSGNRLGVLAALDQRISVCCTLTGMTDQETADYITHHLKVAGRNDTLFSGDAVTLIHNAARGYPPRRDRRNRRRLIIRRRRPRHHDHYGPAQHHRAGPFNTQLIVNNNDAIITKKSAGQHPLAVVAFRASPVKCRFQPGISPGGNPPVRP